MLTEWCTMIYTLYYKGIIKSKLKVGDEASTVTVRHDGPWLSPDPFIVVTLAFAPPLYHV